MQPDTNSEIGAEAASLLRIVMGRKDVRYSEARASDEGYQRPADLLPDMTAQHTTRLFHDAFKRRDIVRVRITNGEYWYRELRDGEEWREVQS